jgi:hypothetical protein
MHTSTTNEIMFVLYLRVKSSNFPVYTSFCSRKKRTQILQSQKGNSTQQINSKLHDKDFMHTSAAFTSLS